MNAPADTQTPEPVSFCSGVGQYHTDKPGKFSKQYNKTALADIVAMVRKPLCVAKSEAQWCIFSTKFSRDHSFQRTYGMFGAAWQDIDENPNTFQHVVDIVKSLLPGVKFFAYLTKSATLDNQKCRIILPYEGLCPGDDHVLVEKILNDLIEKAGIKPDRKTELAGQICYLPNRGETYAYHVETGQALDWRAKFSQELATEKDRLKAEEIAIDARREESQRKYAARLATGTMSPMDAFNATHNIEEYLEYCGYKKFGNRYLSPLSSSGSPGVSVKDGKWISSHDSDRKTIGQFGDVWDLYVFHEHQGDLKAALQAAGDQYTTADGETLTKANQRAYMEQQGQNSQTHYTKDFLAGHVNVEDEPFDLSSFSLNGTSTEMELKMLDDKFVLACMAILGQSTVFYAKPNAGKTLLIIWLTCQAIKRGEIEGSSIFYINADDSHKGLVYKLKLAEERGFNMLAPGYQGFKAEHLPEYLKKMIKSGTASGKVLILDTVKKFTDLMKKDKASQFGETVRQFVSHGGTVIMLAHVNKHRDDDKKVIYAGTSDLVDDADCAYTLDIVSENPTTGIRTVVFENFKSRGDSVREAFYQYNYADGTPYYNRFESVVAVGEDERRAAEQAKALADLLERNQAAIGFIKDCIRENVNQKTALIKEASDRSGLSKKKITQVLQDHTGGNPSENQFWHVAIGKDNAHIFELNYGVL